jgi:uncharacterized phage-associated protein
MPIQFRFHPEKAVEAAAILMKLHGKPMKYLGLLKMLYIADRIALERIEQPITGDHYVSMKYGPVLSGVYDLIKRKPVDDALPLWSEYISPGDKNFVYLVKDPGNDELCEEEEDILQEVYQTFGHLNPFHVAEWTHDLPEWKGSHHYSIPISVEEILRQVGKSEEEIGKISQNLQSAKGDEENSQFTFYENIHEFKQQFISRRDLMKLPLEERRKVLAAQSDLMLQHYQQDQEWKELQTGDFIDY